MNSPTVKPQLRIFVSSPGDVNASREIAALTVERLAQDYARFFRIEPYLWEFEAMVASGHFQDSIEPPSAFDIVVLILWSRLGTHLPERTAVREYRGIDGRTPVTGTEWEFEEAFQAAKHKGAPDLLVYRSLKPALFDTQDPDRFEQQSQQLKALNRFWERHFANRGMFIGAYSSFTSDAEFAEALENHLRKLIERRIETFATRSDSTVIAWAYAPFRGLEPYEFEHAPIFFGQDGAIAKAMLQLITNAESETAFLLVLGASGSGKSSLVKAGILPKLFLPRRVTGAAFLRYIVFRPSDRLSGEDLFDALARRLGTRSGNLDGLPELLQHGQSTGTLAAHLRSATASPAFPIGTALGQIAVSARHSGRMLEYEVPKLVLVLDQLEELFNDERISPSDREQFVQLLGGLARSGHVWVIATMRKDFWHRADETPELVRLAEGTGRVELLPPSFAQFTQMIRRPAEAAGVGFEIHATTNIPLNEAIAEEVAQAPDSLPLLSYLLDQLYRSDVLQSHGHSVTYATYERLGKLEGAIATKAEEILERCAPEDRPALGTVLYSLVDVGRSAAGDVNRAVARRVPLSTFPLGTAQRRLVEAFLDPDARLLVSDAEKNATPTVRVAHEALISRWARAGEFVQRNSESLTIRRRIEERYARWIALQSGATAEPSASSKSGRQPRWTRWLGREQGLLSDIDVIDGRRLLKEHRSETEPQLVGYIDRSIAHEERNRRRTIYVLVSVTCIVAVLAAIAVKQRDMAQLEDSIAKRTTKFMVDMFDNADPDKSRGEKITVRQMLDQGAQAIQSEPDLGRQPRVRAELLTAMGQAYSGLGLYSPAEDLLARARSDETSGAVPAESRIRTLLASGTTLYLAGDSDAAAKYLTDAVSAARQSLPPSDPIRSRALMRLADVLTDQGKYAEAISLCTESLAADRARPPGPEASAIFADTLEALGSAYFFSGDLAAAESPFRQALQLREQVFGVNHARTGEAINNLGALFYQSGRFNEALEEYQLALPIYKKVFGPEHPEVATLVNNIGRSALMAGQLDEAERLLRESLTMTEKFDGESHEHLVAPLNSLAMIDAYRGRTDQARAEIDRAEKIARLPDHGELLDQVLLNKADLDITRGPRDQAAALLKESKNLIQQRYADAKTNAWRYAIWDTVNAELLAVNGDSTSATKLLASAEEIIVRRFGVGSIYNLLAKQRASFIADEGKGGR
jgi:tetratricopeptide (TPR) repeat protein